MKTRKNIYLVVNIFLLTAFCLALSPIVALSQVCGDINGDNRANILDPTYLIEYLVRGGPPPPDFSLAETDGYEKLTMRDIAYWDKRICGGGPLPNCTTVLPPIQPIPDSSFQLSHTNWIEPGVSNKIIKLELFYSIGIKNLLLAFELNIENDNLQIVSIHPSDGTAFWEDIVIAENAAIISIHNFCGSAIDEKVAYDVYISATPSSQRRPVLMTLTRQLSPVQAPAPDSSLITMLIDNDMNVWEPIIFCCLGARGDFNGDGDNGNILDLTHLVDYIFRGSGDPGNCSEETDVNNDGTSSNILDLTTLVDLIFRGGAALPSC